MMNQLVILSGKGGTGKTNFSAAFCHLTSLDAGISPVIVDADVDAANLSFLLDPRNTSREDFYGGSVAVIDAEICESCGRCLEVCRFDAVYETKTGFQVDPIACDGCAACYYQCPEEAISMQTRQAGEWYESNTAYGKFFHAHLYPAQENSGKLVALIKDRARMEMERTGNELMLIDGPPGIGCPVISAVSGATLALIITEPSVSGIHDLERVLETVNHFNVKACVCINKADLFQGGTDTIREYCSQQGVEVLGEIPFDLSVPEALNQGRPVTEFSTDSPAAAAITAIWDKLIDILQKSSGQESNQADVIQIKNREIS